MGILQNENAIPTAVASGFYSYQVQNSVRFENASTSRLYRTAGTPTNVDKYTLSLWIKFCDVDSSASQRFIYQGQSSGTVYEGLYHRPTDDGQIRFQLQNGGTSFENWSNVKLFRDTNAFNHLMFVYDSGNGTASDRNQLYHNGVRVTFNDSRYSSSMSQNRDGVMNTSGATQNIGNGDSYGQSIDAYFAEVLFFDGQTYSPSDVTETKNGVLIPKNPSSLSFGNNGFHLKFENASDLGNDSSGNNNDFTASGLGTDHQSTDSPTFTTD